MTGFRFPNESGEYRERRKALLDKEAELRALGEAVAQQRRELPLGGRLKEDYRFERIGSDGQQESVAINDLFDSHSSLLLYTMMFGPDWDAPCPSCTSLVDAFNSNYHPVSQYSGMAVVAAAHPSQLAEWAERRGWRIPLYSAAGSDYILDYCGYSAMSDPALASIMNVFKKTPEGIFHTWASELINAPMETGHPRHVDVVWPFWNLLDMTPQGRGERSIPKQDYEHAYFTKNVFSEEA